eukprot:TRINITY_DN3124_c0_g1_i3.p1 TRINITY_DN3124_c0_g1~~TRINITY_DN3124_c0_g1_i3.p1  ORF type:complete len:282 (-),score=58.96 TRINITY_DN3124_c0_g1_i3:130-975(-)
MSAIGLVIYLALIRLVFFFFLMIRRPPRSTQGVSSAASDVYKRQVSTQSTWGIVNAYRKYLLVAMLSDKPAEFPKAASALTKSFVSKYCSKYEDLYKCMLNRDAKELKAKINKNREVYFEDKTNSLVEQLPIRLLKTRVQELTKTYMTLSFADIGEKLELKVSETIDLVRDMIENGELNGRIDEKARTVIFSDKEEDVAEMGENIREQEKKIQSILGQLNTLRDDIETSKIYQKKMLQKQDFATDMEFDIKSQFSSLTQICLLYTSPSPRDLSTSRMPSSA